VLLARADEEKTWVKAVILTWQMTVNSCPK